MRSFSAHGLPSGLPYAATDAGNAFIDPATSEFRPRARVADIIQPLAARSAAGVTTCFHGSLPNFAWAIAMPRTVPGTPGARYPRAVSDRSMLPSAPTYIVGVALPGAFSR